MGVSAEDPRSTRQGGGNRLRASGLWILFGIGAFIAVVSLVLTMLLIIAGVVSQWSGATAVLAAGIFVGITLLYFWTITVFETRGWAAGQEQSTDRDCKWNDPPNIN